MLFMEETERCWCGEDVTMGNLVYLVTVRMTNTVVVGDHMKYHILKVPSRFVLDIVA